MTPETPGRGSWYDLEWVRCIRCRGSGERVECYDDLCHAQGREMRDTGPKWKYEYVFEPGWYLPDGRRMGGDSP